MRRRGATSPHEYWSHRCDGCGLGPWLEPEPVGLPRSCALRARNGVVTDFRNRGKRQTWISFCEVSELASPISKRKGTCEAQRNPAAFGSRSLFVSSPCLFADNAVQSSRRQNFARST